MKQIGLLADQPDVLRLDPDRGSSGSPSEYGRGRTADEAPRPICRSRIWPRRRCKEKDGCWSGQPVEATAAIAQRLGHGAGWTITISASAPRSTARKRFGPCTSCGARALRMLADSARDLCGRHLFGHDVHRSPAEGQKATLTREAPRTVRGWRKSSALAAWGPSARPGTRCSRRPAAVKLLNDRHDVGPRHRAFRATSPAHQFADAPQCESPCLTTGALRMAFFTTPWSIWTAGSIWTT